VSHPIIDGFVAWQHEFNGVSADRLVRVRKMLLELELHVGGDLTQVTDQSFASFLQAQSARGLHPNTVRKNGNMIRPFFKWAWREKLITAERLMELETVRNPRGATNQSKPRPYSRKEVAQLWEDIDATYPKAKPHMMKRWRKGTSRYAKVWRHGMGLQVEAIAHLALHGGMRRDEIFRATIDEVHPDNDYLVVQGAAKGSGERGYRERNVPMTVDTRRAMHNWLEFRAWMKPDHDALWLGANGFSTDPKLPMCNDAFQYLMGKVGRGWELQRLRHTCATEWLRAGMAIEQVQRLLGHARLQQTLAYAEIVPDDLSRGARRVEGNFSRAIGRPGIDREQEEQAA
jgi:site-specific recombinase XerD